MGAVIQNASTPLAGYEQGYVILGGLLLVGGIIGLLFIRPEADRARLAAHAVSPAAFASPPAPDQGGSHAVPCPAVPCSPPCRWRPS